MNPWIRPSIYGSLAGLLWGFLFVFQPLFTDGPQSLSSNERIVSYVLCVLAYGAFAFLFTRIQFQKANPFLAAPGLLIGLLYTDPIFLLRFILMVAVFVGVIVGHMGGLNYRTKTDRADV